MVGGEKTKADSLTPLFSMTRFYSSQNIKVIMKDLSLHFSGHLEVLIWPGACNIGINFPSEFTAATSKGITCILIGPLPFPTPQHDSRIEKLGKLLDQVTHAHAAPKH